MNWHDRYKELKNRQDTGGDLTFEERAELDQLEIRLSEPAAQSATQLQNAHQETGTNNVADLIPQILQSPGAKRFGFNEANLAGMNPGAVQQIAAGLGIGATPTPPPVPPAAGLGNAAPAIAQSQISAFDRPQPVIIMGPNPLPVKIEGKLPGSAEEQSTGGEQGKQRGGGIGEHVNRLLDILSQPSPGRNQSGPNLFRFIRAMKRTGGGLVRGVRGLGGKTSRKSRDDDDSNGPHLTPGQLRKLSGFAESGGAAAGAGEAAGAGAAAGGAELAAAAGPIGAAAAAAVVFTAAMVEAGKQVYAFARAQEAEIRKLAEVGGAQAVGVARLDAERIGRDIKTAQETGGTSLDLTQSLSKFEEALRPIESALTNIANAVGSSVLDYLTEVVKYIEPIADLLIDIYNALPGRQIDKKKMEHEFDQSALEQVRRLDDAAWQARQPQWPAGVGRRR